MQRTTAPALMIPWLLVTAGCPLLFSPHPPTFVCTTSADCADGHLCDAYKGLCVPTGTATPDHEPDPPPDDGGRDLDPDPDPDPGPDAGAEPDPPPDDGGAPPDSGAPPDGGAPTCADDWDDISSPWRLPITVEGAASGEVLRLTLNDDDAERLLAASGGERDDVRVFIGGIEQHRVFERFTLERVQFDIAVPSGVLDPLVVQLYVGGPPTTPMEDAQAVYPLAEDFASRAVGDPDVALGVGTPAGRWSIVDEAGERFLRVDGASRQAFELADVALEAGTLEARMRFGNLTTNHSGLMVGASSFEPDNLDTYVAQLLASEQTHAIKRYTQGVHSVVDTAPFGASPDTALVADRWYALRVVKRTDGGLAFWVDDIRRQLIPSITPDGDQLGLFAFSGRADFDDLRVRPFPATSPTVTPGMLAPRCTDTPGFCGDGTLDDDLGESCDDGNLVPGDGCDAQCSVDVVLPAPAARWRLDTNAGTASDSAGDADGAVHGALFGYDDQRRFRHLSGDAHVDVGQPASLDIAGDITLAAWVRVPSSDGLRNIVSRGHRFAPDHGIHLRLSGGQFQGGYWDGADALAATAIAPDEIGRWVHLAVTHVDGVWRLFVDGALRDSNPGPGVAVFDAPWAIGRRGANALEGDPRFFVGDVSDVRIYDVGLTDAEVAALAAGAE